MPIYRWVNTETGEEREVVMSIRESDTPPLTEEEKAMEGEASKWVKVMQPTQKHINALGYGKKGCW